MRRPPDEKKTARVGRQPQSEPNAFRPSQETSGKPDSTPSTTGNRIADLRRQRRWTHTFLGALAGLSGARVRQIELGTGSPVTRAEIVRLARSLSVGNDCISGGAA
jgi:hypothetical protein